ncbi:DEAD/DEAH box helicase [Arsenicicoccus piscis]|uniref:RNA helicase n=1 Tax=Arsenicicoccus piscis TaxID=673954 RepID=A0ABQ6HLW7_9MICO|nr:DEAD/DEAH box helicase [Arsenicicoccus piscis]MCH8628224.1 DEAD/DEAH box helicase [Arsenicicoccus piscis]GMA18469.1 DNA helicase [Arsenicicoccus piscis]
MSDQTQHTDASVASSPSVETVAAPEAPKPTFADFGVHPDIVAALDDAGITHPFPIQAMTLPVALDGHDIIGQAKTGTGKTLGFGVPILQRVVSPTDAAFATLPHAGKPQALAVAPTRELAVQVASDLKIAGRRRGVRVAEIYGGRAFEPQIEALQRGVEVVVGTPGRLLDLAKQRHLDLSHCSIVVLDEADEMLDLGFLPDVEAILARTAPQRQTMLFSATMPGPVVAMARRYMSRPTHIRAMHEEGSNAHTVAAIEQLVYRAHALDKVEMLARILQAKDRGLTIIFSRTKRTAAKVAEELTERGFAAGSLHGDLGQGAREQALRAFRNGHIDILVATDVAARGIDVENVTHVINYQCPEDEKTYVHRVGRTGRAGHTGIAVTLVDWDDLPRWSLINKALDLGIAEPPETYSSSPHLYADLSIPEGTTGRLPKSKQVRDGLAAERLEDLGETGRHGGSGQGGSGRDAGRGSGRGGSGRGGSGRGGAGRGEGRAESRGEARADTRGESGERPRRQRSRRRTRGGKPAEGSTPNVES